MNEKKLRKFALFTLFSFFTVLTLSSTFAGKVGLKSEEFILWALAGFYLVLIGKVLWKGL